MFACFSKIIIIFVPLNFKNINDMKQRIITVSRRYTAIDVYAFNLDNVTKQLNDDGWIVKQIVSTSFTHQINGTGTPYPVLVITLLVEQE